VLTNPRFLSLGYCFLPHAVCILNIPAETGMGALGDSISAATLQTLNAVTVTFIAITFEVAKHKGGTVTDCAET
jgi:hypothetical protein